MVVQQRMAITEEAMLEEREVEVVVAAAAVAMDKTRIPTIRDIVKTMDSLPVGYVAT